MVYGTCGTYIRLLKTRLNALTGCDEVRGRRLSALTAAETDDIDTIHPGSAACVSITQGWRHLSMNDDEDEDAV